MVKTPEATADAVLSARVPSELLEKFDRIVEAQSLGRGAALRLLIERAVITGRVEVRADLDKLAKAKR